MSDYDAWEWTDVQRGEKFAENDDLDELQKGSQDPLEEFSRIIDCAGKVLFY